MTTKKELRQRCIDNETAIATLETLLKEHGIVRKQEPKLKQLGQSVFEGQDEDIIYAAIKSNGDVIGSSKRINLVLGGEFWAVDMSAKIKKLGEGYDTTNWQNSLIERKELTGSDLARAMLERGDKYVWLTVSDQSDEHAIRCPNIAVGESIFYSDDGIECIQTTDSSLMEFGVPINNQGEPLTAADVGL